MLRLNEKKKEKRENSCFFVKLVMTLARTSSFSHIQYAEVVLPEVIVFVCTAKTQRERESKKSTHRTLLFLAFTSMIEIHSFCFWFFCRFIHISCDTHNIPLIELTTTAK